MEYNFDNAFCTWLGGRNGFVPDSGNGILHGDSQDAEVSESAETAFADKGAARKAVISLNDYYSVEEVSTWIGEYGITVERVYMWPEGETGRLSLSVENGGIQDAIENYIRQTEETGLLQDNEQFRKDYERFLNGEYKVFALTVAAPDGILSLFKPLKVLKWDIGCVSHIKLMDSGDSRELPSKPDGAL